MQPDDVSILWSRDKWSRKIKNKSNKNWGILPIKQLCIWNGGAWDITVKWCIWLVQRYKSSDLGKCAFGCGCLEKPFKSHLRYVIMSENDPRVSVLSYTHFTPVLCKAFTFFNTNKIVLTKVVKWSLLASSVLHKGFRILSYQPFLTELLFTYSLN